MCRSSSRLPLNRAGKFKVKFTATDILGKTPAVTQELDLNVIDSEMNAPATESASMSPLQDRIAQFRKMANDDPDNELGHYRLGQLLMEDKQYGEAVQSFRRTLELSPTFSKVYQLLAQCLLARQPPR